MLIPFLFSSCETVERTGTLEYQISSSSDYFHVYYTNQYDNDVTEVSYTNIWSKQFEVSKGVGVTLNFNEGGPSWGTGSGDEEVEITMSISFNGNSLISYSGLTDYETLSTLTQ